MADAGHVAVSTCYVRRSIEIEERLRRDCGDMPRHLDGKYIEDSDAILLSTEVSRVSSLCS